MGDVLDFQPRPKKKPTQGNTLCKSGFHKWVVDKAKQFDVKQGRLVTVRRCVRCGVTKITLA
jgi:hypothetical protein